MGNIKALENLVKKMKFISVIGTLFVCLSVTRLASAEEGMDYHSEFWQGMESGFFLRDIPNGHVEYECPDPNVDEEIAEKLKTFLAPVQMVVNMLDNEIVKALVGSIEIYI